MEKRGVSSVLMVCLLLGVLVGQSTVEAEDGGNPPGILDAAGCYAGCMIRCMLDGNGVGSCALACLRGCLLPKSTVALKDTQTFCRLGCATALCSKISTKDNIAEKKVASCVDSCSATCAKKT